MSSISAVAALCALVLVATAVAKIASPAIFLTVLSDVLPKSSVGLARWAVIFTEVFIAVALILRPKLGGAFALMFVFGATVVAVLRLYRRDEFNCGCWGGNLSSARHPKYRSSVGPLIRLVIQNSMLAQAALWVMLAESVGWYDWASALGLLLVPSVVAIGIAGDIVRRRRSLPHASSRRLSDPKARLDVAA